MYSLLPLLFFSVFVHPVQSNSLEQICSGITNIYNCEATIKIPDRIKPIYCDQTFFRVCQIYDHIQVKSYDK